MDERPAPAWVPPLFLALALALVPWTVWLAYDLPRRHVARHWDVAWAGFDVALTVALVATAVAAVRRSPAVQGCAGVAATLLGCDAWFDILTAAHGREMAIALAQAAFLELPLAGVCFWLARNAERVSAQAHLYAGAARRLRGVMTPSRRRRSPRLPR